MMKFLKSNLSLEVEKLKSILSLKCLQTYPLALYLESIFSFGAGVKNKATTTKNYYVSCSYIAIFKLWRAMSYKAYFFFFFFFTTPTLVGPVNRRFPTYSQ